MFEQILILALAIACVSANLEFVNCGSASQIVALRLRGCDQVPCTLRRGGEYYLEMDVITAAPTPTLSSVIQAFLGFLLPPVTIFSGDACEGLTLGDCPTEVGERITARLYIDIPNTLLARIVTSVRATVRDFSNKVQVCAQIPVTVV